MHIVFVGKQTDLSQVVDEAQVVCIDLGCAYLHHSAELAVQALALSCQLSLGRTASRKAPHQLDIPCPPP